jgi:PilZ domain
MEARREPRFTVRLCATLRTEAGAAPVRLLDLSRGGALLETRTSLVVGTRVTLMRERLEVEARVASSCGIRCGLTFASPISATALFLQLARSRAAGDAPWADLGRRDGRAAGRA